jgi:hypothetical protein
MGRFSAQLKSTGAEVVSIIAALLGILPGLFKKKKYCLWYHAQDMKWVKKAGPFSARQCKATMATLVKDLHYAENAFLILREGVLP